MTIIDKIKYKIGHWVLNKELLEHKRTKQLTNFSQAKSVGILYYLESELQYNIILEFVKKLQCEQKVVKALGMVPDKIMPHYCYPKIFFDYIMLNNLNWYKKPETKCATDFINYEYDILIDLTTESSFIIEYIAALSKAKLKIGKADKLRKKYYDITIDVDSNKDLKYLIEQMVYYLSMLKK